MAGINTAGVIKGGMVAGIIINISQSVLNVAVIGEQMEAALAARNLPPVGGSAIAVFIAMCFVLGLLMIWCTRPSGRGSVPDPRRPPALAWSYGR